MARIGVFLCNCSLSPLKPAATEELAGIIGKHRSVISTEICPDMCMDPGIGYIKDIVQEKKLDGVVFTTCSSTIHGDGFYRVMASLGFEAHQVEIVDLKQWQSRSAATGGHISVDRGAKLIQDAIHRLEHSRAGEISRIPVVKRALVIGGGVAGIQAALDIADGGYKVVLVEKNPSIGGHMIQYSEVFPTLDCPQCIMTPKMVDIAQHPNITLLTYAEIQRVRGRAGNFEVEILQKARKVDHTKCTGCGTCWQKCPEKVPSEFDAGVSERTAIYVPFAQAVPAKPVIDTENCRYIKYLQFLENGGQGKKPPECRICEKLCTTGAIDWKQKPQILTENFGGIVVATGFELMPVEEIHEYAEDPDIIDGIKFERILCPGGPTSGVVKRPSDGKIPKEVVFVSCAGSRDPEHGVPYCSRVCCMYLLKQAMLYKHAVPEGQAYIFYMDIRTTGKGYEEFVQRAVNEGVLYLRGKVAKIFRDGDKLSVWGADTLSGHRVEVACDLVVLGMAMMPSPGISDLAQKLGFLTDEYGFIVESHPKLHPLETSVPGIFVAGTAQGPKDIPDSVAQSSGAAGKILSFLSQDEIAIEELVVN
jgi:heterodisulfide reductase subunit A